MNPRQRRAVLLLALAFAGLIGVFALVANYVSDVNTQVGPKVTVFELRRTAPKNQAITDDMLVQKQVPRRWAPSARLTDITQVIGYVPSSDLAPHSILQEGMLVQPPDLGEGEREVAILVDASTGVAGKIEPGRLVDVIAAFPGDQDGKRPNRSIVVVSGAKVLAVGQPRIKGGNGAQEAQQDPSQVVPVTFALSKRQELRVSYAQSFASDVRLALVRPGDQLDRTLDETIFKGADPKKGESGER
jgi:pilus assembly protein CpaB